MAYEKVKRNRYFDPPFEFPHTSRNHAEDQQEFHRPLTRMHNAHAHDWGIAEGLEVSGAIGGTEVVIEPGVALNGQGELISLSPDGQGDIGSNPPGGQHNAVSVPVQLGLGSHAGQTVYVTIQFSEILRPAEGSGGRMEQVPWVRFQPVSGAGAYVDDGASVILAIVDINAAGNLTALRAEDSAVTYGRRVIGQSLKELRIQRSTKVGNSVEETTSGKIGPGVGGGLRLTVLNSGDGVSIAKEDGGNFANLELRANTVVAKDAAGREALSFNAASAALTIGTDGNEGDLMVKDGAGRQVMRFDGQYAALYIGANGNEGDLIVRDSAGAESARIDGNTGKLNIKRIDPYGHALDIDARFVRIHGWDLVLDGRSGGNKRALVDNNNRLVINWANDYANGVDIGKLHLQDHIKSNFWEARGEWNPGRRAWHTFYEQNTGLNASEWRYVTMCEIGMFDNGSVDNFWWQTNNASYVDGSGNIVIRWNIEYNDRGTDWYPWHRAVFWLAYRR